MDDAPAEMQMRFWRGFTAYLDATRSPFSLVAKPAPGLDLRPKCTPHIWVTVRVSTQPERLTTDLTFSAAGHSEYERIYASLRPQIDDSLGLKGIDYDDLQWVSVPHESESHVKVFRYVDPRNEAHWGDYYDWLKARAIVLHQWGKS